MSHLEESTLESLISGAATRNDVQRIRRHVDGCRACARRLEEWRDNYAELDQVFPELAGEVHSGATVTPGGMVVVPIGESRPRFELDLATVLWIAALLMALLVGYGANRLRHANDGFSALADGRPARPARDTAGASAQRPAVAPPAAVIDSTVRPAPSAQPSGPSPRPAPASPPAPVTTPGPPPASRQQPVVVPSSGDPARVAVDSAADPPKAMLPVSPKFTMVPLLEAARQLGGPIRLLHALGDPDHVELGPGSAVPGAPPALEVARVVYRTADGGRILLDQQLIPPDSNGFRSINDPTLERGDVAYGTAPNGVSVATWVDEEGYRLSLVARASVDSLQKLITLVH
jgi:hypothetical protein